MATVAAGVRRTLDNYLQRERRRGGICVRGLHGKVCRVRTVRRYAQNDAIVRIQRQAEVQESVADRERIRRLAA